MIRDVLLREAGAASPVQDAPEIRHALRARYERAARFVAPASIPTATLFAVALLPSADNTALLIWWSIIVVQLIGYRPVLFGDHPLDRWLRSAAIAQFVGGLAWGLLGLIAMPAATEWQMFVAALMLGVLASNAVFAAAMRRLFIAFLAPFTAMTTLAFLINASGPTRWAAIGLTIYGAGFSTVLASLRRADDIEAAALGINNGRLAESLEAESEALRVANADLADVNDRLEYEATHDSLTGLAGRPVFTDTLEQALAEETTPGSVAVMFLDLDRFKFVNDSLGHTVGDALLQAVAKRLETTIEPGELLARLGGDELVALVRLGPSRTASTVTERVLEVLAEPFVVADRPLTIGASVGIAVSDGESTGPDLLRFADTALLRSKTSGRGRGTVFDAAMRLELDRRSHMAGELREAIRKEQMEAFLQPIVDLATGEPVGAEALSRWPHHTGLRSAGAYMDLAAELGLEADISIGVIEAVAAHQRELDTAATTPWITVNMPPQQLSQVFEHFADSPRTLANLTLEITERAAVADLGQAQQLLSEAREAGAKVFLDDFGVGQSSLSVLTDLPLDGIKIDAGFVRQLSSSESARAVVQTVNDLGRRLDLTIVAEGVETEEQAEQLRHLGIRLAQGFLFAPPMPTWEFPAWCEMRRAEIARKRNGTRPPARGGRRIR